MLYKDGFLLLEQVILSQRLLPRCYLQDKCQLDASHYIVVAVLLLTSMLEADYVSPVTVLKMFVSIAMLE